jgi:hypothetical protein
MLKSSPAVGRDEGRVSTEEGKGKGRRDVPELFFSAEDDSPHRARDAIEAVVEDAREDWDGEEAYGDVGCAFFQSAVSFM